MRTKLSKVRTKQKMYAHKERWSVFAELMRTKLSKVRTKQKLFANKERWSVFDDAH